MHESLSAGGRLGRQTLPRHPRNELACDADGIDHPARRQTGMNVVAVHRHGGQVGGKRLVLDHAVALAVQRVGGDRVEGVQINMVRAATDFFVAGIANADGAVLDFGMGHQVIRSGHDDGHTALVIGTQKRGAVAGDDRLAHHLPELLGFLDANHLLRAAR